MTRQPRKMRRREREALERLFTQLMKDLAAIRAPPLEWTVRSTRGPLRVSLWSELPAVKLRSPAGQRWTFTRPIGPHLPIFVELTTWLCQLLQNPEPERKTRMATPIQATIDASAIVASWSNHNYEMTDTCRHRVELLRHRAGRYLMVAVGGLPAHRETQWVTVDSARRFIVEHAMDPRDGWGYTEEETAAIMEGQAVHGTRDFDGGRLTPRPHLADFI